MSEALEARIRELEKGREILKIIAANRQSRVLELEAELEARKKAWEDLKGWIFESKNGFDHEHAEYVSEWVLSKDELISKLTALEATLPKGGA